MNMIRAITRREFSTRLGASALGLAVLGSGVLAGCASQTPARQTFPELSYAHLGKRRLDVARIEIVSEYRAPLAPPNIEHQFPIVPEQALRRWAQDRLAAAGTQGRYARFVIQDAAVTDTLLPKTEGVRGAFTTDQTDRYDGTLAAALEIREERGNFINGNAVARVTRSRTTPEGLSINEREKIWFEMVEAMMNDFNAQLDSQINSNLTRYLTS